jgi:hypothetical protein
VAALVAGGVVAGLRSGGYEGPPDRKPRALAVWQWVVVGHAAGRIAAPDDANDPSIPSADKLDVAGFVDQWLSHANGRVARDFGRFLAYLEHFAPIGCGFASRFTRLAAPEQDQVLAALQASRSDLLRAGFEGLKALVFMGYYRDPRTWAVLGYDGPFVGRPLGGWR